MTVFTFREPKGYESALLAAEFTDNAGSHLEMTKCLHKWAMELVEVGKDDLEKVPAKEYADAIEKMLASIKMSAEVADPK